MLLSAEVQQLEKYLTFPINKSTLIQILYDNKFSTQLCNIIQEASFDNFNSFADVIYAVNNYHPSIL